MGKQTGFVAAVVLGALLLGGASVAVGQEKVKAKAVPAADMAALANIVANYRALIYRVPQPCGDTDCAVQITLKVVPVDGHNVCIVNLPESLIFTNSEGGRPVEIAWTLNTGGYLVEFPTRSGIVVVDDAKSQIDPDNQRTDMVTYKAKNKHNKKGSATYVPVVLYRAEAGQAPSVCASGDPQIVNN
jgi:hypothetical protein